MKRAILGAQGGSTHLPESVELLNETFFSEFIKKSWLTTILMGDLVRLDPSLRVLFNRWRNVLV